jgi:hypothetical protein
MGRNSNRVEINSLKIGGIKFKSKQIIAQEFNKYFVNIAEKINNRENNKHMDINNIIKDGNHINFVNHAFTRPYPNMNCSCCTSKEIEEIVKSLKTKNSYGYDEISPMILKVCSPFISSPINYICNKMLRTGVFPERLKYTLIKPLHKNGDIGDMTNYRPI